MQRTKQPRGIDEWFKQVAEHPKIPAESKNSSEDQIKLTSTEFTSGSVVTATETLHMRLIWPECRSVEDLGSMMTDDSKDDYKGYVSAANMSKAKQIFNNKRSIWDPYLKEVKSREVKLHAAGKKPNSRKHSAQPLQLGDELMPPPPQPKPQPPRHRSGNEGPFFPAVLYWQRVGLKKVNQEDPTLEELEETSSISKPGPEHAPVAVPALSSVNRPITPLKPKFQGRAVLDAPEDGIFSTPEVVNYYPARGGKANSPAADETFINTALLLLLQSITLGVGAEFSTLDWLATRLPFHLKEKIVTENIDNGDSDTQERELMEARVDGYLCRRSSPWDEEFNENALAIVESKRYVRSSAYSAIQRQEGAEMACWISDAGDSGIGFLEPGSDSRKRRLMISQDRHEIYVIVAEYGTGYENHIRPSSLIMQGSAAAQQGLDKPVESTAKASSKAAVSSAISASTSNPQSSDLLTDSPSYSKRAQSKSIKMESSSKNSQGQQTQSGPKTDESPSTQQKWCPNDGDFLYMNEFGPFLTTDADHMEVFIRRLIALMLQLRGPQRGFMPEPVGTKFLHQPGEVGPSKLDDEPSRPRPLLKRSRSWPEDTIPAEKVWVRDTVTPNWRG